VYTGSVVMQMSQMWSLILVLVACRPLLATEPSTAIEKLVVVYSTKYDPDAAFSSLGWLLSPILDAAEHQKMKVVFYRADEPDSPEGKAKFIAKLTTSVGDRHSWLYLAAHGSSIEERGKALGTVFDLPGHPSIFELGSILNHSNVKGSLLTACSVFSEDAKYSKNVVCGTSFPPYQSSIPHAQITVAALAKLIRNGAADPRYFLASEILQGAKLQPQVLESMISGDRRRSVVPVSGHESAQNYTFKGSKFEMVDENDRPIRFCSLDILRTASRVTGFIQDLTFVPPEGKNVLPGNYSIKPRGERPEAYPSISCVDGHWEFKSPQECRGIETSLNDCEKSFASRNKKTWFGQMDQMQWKKQCGQLRSMVAEAENAGMKLPRLLCLTGCSEDIVLTDSFAQVAPTSCSAVGNGGRCNINLYHAPISSMPQEKECCSTTFARTFTWDENGQFCRPKCFDSSKNSEATNGECFVSELPTYMNAEGEYKSDPAAIWQCASSEGRVAVTEQCCNAIPNRLYRNGFCTTLGTYRMISKNHR
jgi:hypothetical protein